MFPSRHALYSRGLSVFGVIAHFFQLKSVYILLILQIEYVLQEKPQLKETKDWKELYASLRRKYGLREEFTEMIMLCRKCCALFWKSLGHPCFVLAEEAVFTVEASTEATTAEANANLPAEVENKKEGGQNGQHHGEQLIPVSPKSFLTFFSV